MLSQTRSVSLSLMLLYTILLKKSILYDKKEEKIMNNEKMLIKSGLNKKGQQKYSEVKVYKKLPKGWKETTGTMTDPHGYKWIDNGQSLFIKGKDGKYTKNTKREIALLKKK